MKILSTAGAVLFESSTETMMATVSEAVEARANLSGANLSGANLYGANLYGALNATLAQSQTEIQPREGEVIGWKKCRNGVLVKLRVPPDAERSNATGRKCRARCVEVLEVVGAETGVSIHDGETAYRKGETVSCDDWDPCRWNECSGGIHYFITRDEAEAFNY